MCLNSCPSWTDIISARNRTRLPKGSGCGTIGAVHASNTRDPRLESRHWQILNTVNSFEQAKINKKDSGNGTISKYCSAKHPLKHGLKRLTSWCGNRVKAKIARILILTSGARQATIFYNSNTWQTPICICTVFIQFKMFLYIILAMPIWRWLGTVWPVKNRQMSIKVAKNDFTTKAKDFDTFTKIAWECRRFGQINCCQRLWKVAQSAINYPIWSHWLGITHKIAVVNPGKPIL